MRILLAEDEKELSDALVAILEYHHYSVDVVYDGESAYEYGHGGNYDIMILDIMMPKLSGIQVLDRLRKDGIYTPAMFLTAKSSTEDKITGLDTGADDYMTKPFEMGEFLARIRALSRRTSSFTSSVLEFGNIILDTKQSKLICEGRELVLNNKEFQVLEILMRNQGKTVASERIFENIWGYDAEAEINVVWVNISNLRRRLQKLQSNVEIKAIRGVGYVLEQGS